MLSKKPYLLRAMYEWIVDNGWTPHIVVDTEINEASVPEQYIQDGHIILNIAVAAVQGLDIGNDEVTFSARFSGTPFDIRFPIDSVAGIYARENNEGLQFVVTKSVVDEPIADEETEVTPVVEAVKAEEKPDESEEASVPTKPRPKLTVVKPTKD